MGIRAVRSPVELALALLVAAVWLIPFPWYPALNNPNEQARIYTTRAIVDHQTYRIDDVIAELGPINDVARNDRGETIAAKAPGASWLAVPGYATLRAVAYALQMEPSPRAVTAVCRLTASTLPMLAFFAFFADRARRVFPRASIRRLGVGALACGSTLLPYGVLFTSHAVASAALFVAFVLVEEHRNVPRRISLPIATGALLAGAVTLEYPAVVGAAVVLVWGAYRTAARARYLLWIGVGAALPLLLLAHFHWSALGTPFTTPYAHLANPGYRELFASGPLRGSPDPGAVANVLFAPSGGLFWFMPWTLPVVAALPLAIARTDLRRHVVVPLAIFAAYMALTALLPDARGGWTAGPRYIVPVVPFLAWALMAMVASLGDRPGASAVAIGAAALIAAAAFLCGISAAVYPHYPEPVLNPVFEIAVYALQHGYMPHTSLDVVGVAPTLALGTLAGCVVLAATAGIASWEPMTAVERGAAVALSLALALAVLRLQAQPTTPDAGFLGGARALVTEHWSPARSPLAADLRSNTLPERLATSTDPAQLERAAAAAAREGYAETALSLYLAARMLRNEARAADRPAF